MGGKPGAPIIVKRKKVVAEESHHGGAWKVAYADFVTAMMAFFMLMWLLNATTEQQREGLAEYFSPEIPISRVSGGGTDALNGDSIFAENTLSRSGTGGSRTRETATNAAGGTSAGPSTADRAAYDRVTEALSAAAGESTVSEKLEQHIITRVTDEGLLVEIYARPGAPLFRAATATATPLTRELARIVADSFDLVLNDVAVETHLRSPPVVQRERPIWRLSTERARNMRELLEVAGLASGRTVRLTGHGDRESAVNDPMAARNDRVEMILLRSDI